MSAFAETVRARVSVVVGTLGEVLSPPEHATR